MPYSTALMLRTPQSMTQTPQTVAYGGVVSTTPSRTCGALRYNLTMCGRRPTYTFHVGYIKNVTPDGVTGPEVLGINGLFPAPTIEVWENDNLVVTVINDIVPGAERGTNHTSLHWHGLLQKGSPLQDGVNHITQCPIKSGSRREYNFHIKKQSGTYWYHSHLRSQYTEGLYGAFIIHPIVPKPFYFDKRRIIQLSDWYHTTAKENEVNFANIYIHFGGESSNGYPTGRIFGALQPS